MEELITIPRPSPQYPGSVEVHLGDSAPTQLTAKGDLSILDHPLVALFCSRNCPGDLASQAYDVAQHLRDSGATVCGGFHSPMENECLRILLSSPHPVVIGFGRCLEGARLPASYSRPLREGRLLVLSRFGPDIDRVTKDTAYSRNLLVAALAAKVFVAHAKPESGTMRFCEALLAWGKPLYTLASPKNENLLSMGALSLAPAEVREQLA